MYDLSHVFHEVMLACPDQFFAGLRDAAVGGGCVGDHNLALVRRQRHRSEGVREGLEFVAALDELGSAAPTVDFRKAASACEDSRCRGGGRRRLRKAVLVMRNRVPCAEGV